MVPIMEPTLATSTNDDTLQRSETHFQHLLEKLPAGAYTCDPEGLITYFNRQAVELWGRSPKLNDPVDRWCGSFKLHSTEGTPIPHDECWMALVLKQAAPFNGHEIIVERPDGQRRTALAHANPIRDDSGNLVGAVNVLVDITERKRAERSLRELQLTNEELEERNRDLEQFAYVASHDLQEPLRTVTSFLQLLERQYGDQLDDTGRQYVAYAEEGAQRMHQLIGDLLAYSRVGTRGARLVRVDMRAIVTTVLKDFRDEPEAVVDVGDLPIITGDPSQLHQLLQNLIANGIKFSQPGRPPHITIRAEPAGSDAWLFSVSDQGIGVDMEHAARVFEVFQRLHRRDEYEGAGIGLAICKRIVERHGGRIWVESKPGRGATFYFTVPGEPGRAG